MTDKMNEAIQEIAVKHGVVLSKDDPILVLQTMNERLLEETRKAQQEILAEFREEMENISSQWKNDAKKKAERILNAALSSSKEAVEKIINQTSNESAHVMKKLILDALVEIRELTQRTRRYNQLWLIGLMIASSLFLLFILK